MERIAPEKIHINDVDESMNPLNFLFNYDWINASRYKTIKYPIYDESNKKDKVQLYFFQTDGPGQLLYSQPSYVSALPWITL